ncbi:MAG TPA: cobalamin-dependent protein, partial [Rhodanobacteraceae bacterium]|nr:cobalamin-dependent protein [Rhodanobacteraceae bacterium]
MSQTAIDLSSREAKPDTTPLRFVTAASLFDGHDAAINIMRRIIQSQGAEVIHLGHNRSVEDVVRAALQEDADGIALSSYQGGHVEYFKYMVDMLRERGAGHIRVFGGGGGTITPEEIRELQDYGVERIYHPNDGMHMGLVQMIEDVVERAGHARDQGRRNGDPQQLMRPDIDDEISIGQMLSAVEDGTFSESELKMLRKQWAGAAHGTIPVIGITGTGGAGKSSVVDELLLRFLHAFPQMRIAVLAVDPTRRKGGGALLGDRIRMNALRSHRVFMRSMATRRAHAATSSVLHDCIAFLKSMPFDLVIVETAGIGQADTEIVDLVDFPVYVMTSDYGAASQLEKIDMLDFAQLVVLNKYDRRGAEDALRDVRKQWKRNHTAFQMADDDVPVYPTIASQFNDPGVTWMFVNLCRLLREKVKGAGDAACDFKPQVDTTLKEPRATVLIPGKRVRYLAEIAEQGRAINAETRRMAEAASKAQHYYESLRELEDTALPRALDLYERSALSFDSGAAQATNPHTQPLSRGERGESPVRAEPSSPQESGVEAQEQMDSGLRRNDEQSGVRNDENAVAPAQARAQARMSREAHKTQELDSGLRRNDEHGERRNDELVDRSLILLRQRYNEAVKELSAEAIQLLRDWPARKDAVTAEFNEYTVRGKAIKVS